MTNSELKEENAKLREILALIRRDLLACGKRFLDEAEHSRAVGASEVQFAATTAAATIEGALETIAFHTTGLK